MMLLDLSAVWIRRPRTSGARTRAHGLHPRAANVAPFRRSAPVHVGNEVGPHESDLWPLATVDAVLGLSRSNTGRRVPLVVLGAALVLILAACGSGAAEQAQVASATPALVPTPTSLPTTAPLAVPTATPAPAPAPTAPAAVVPEATSTPVATALPTPNPIPAAETGPAPTAVPAPDPSPSPLPDADTAPASTAVPTATVQVTETPTAMPTMPATEPDPQGEDNDSSTTATPVAVATTAVVATSGEAPLECYDRDVQVYRAHVDGVDDLSFEGGRVYCSGAGTNAVSAAGSYRHSSGLVVQRNADFIFNADSTAYIPYSGSVHFCLNAQPASAPVVADTVPALLVVIDQEAQRQLGQGATAPAGFSASGAQC